MPITGVTYTPTIANAGSIADGRIMRFIHSRTLLGSANPGLATWRVPVFGGAQYGLSTRLLDPGQVWQVPSPLTAASVNAIVTAFTTSTSVQVISGTGLNGAVGATTMLPGRRITLVLNNNANWDATTAVVAGISDETGLAITENVSIPDTGNTTLTTTNVFRSVTSITIPAQSGTGGTATFGIAALDASITIADFGGVLVYNEMIPPANASFTYTTGAVVETMRKGAIWVVSEEATLEGGDVYARIVAGAGGSVLGAFRTNDDTSSAIQITGARYGRDSAAGLALVELY